MSNNHRSAYDIVLLASSGRAKVADVIPRYNSSGVGRVNREPSSARTKMGESGR
jgi:hypothetical protein